MISSIIPRSFSLASPTTLCSNKFLSITLTILGILAVVGGIVARHYGLNVIALNLWVLGGAAFLAGNTLFINRVKNLLCSKETKIKNITSVEEIASTKESDQIIYDEKDLKKFSKLGVIELRTEFEQGRVNVNSIIRDTNTTLTHWAYENNEFFLSHFLMLSFGNFDHKNDQNETIMTTAMKNGDSAMVFYLLDKGADPNTQLEDGTSVLHWSILKEEMIVFEMALFKNANPTIKNKWGETPMTVAIQRKDPSLIIILLEQGGDSNTQLPESGTSLFQWAIEENVIDVITYLVAIEADPNILNKNNETALTAAMKKNYHRLVYALLARGGDPNTIMPECGTSLLHWSIESNNKALWERAIALKPNPNIKSKNGKTAITAAAELEDQDLLIALLSLGGDPQTLLANGQTLLQWANEKQFQKLSKYIQKILRKKKFERIVQAFSFKLRVS